MKSKYFKIQELVSKGVYDKYGESSWKFIDERLIQTIDIIREFFDAPMTINNWLWGGNLQQRGYRANKDEMVKNKNGYYCSQHCHGRAVDFNIKGYTTKEVYDKIIKHKQKFPYLKRIENVEKTPTWVHIDLANVDNFTIFN